MRASDRESGVLAFDSVAATALNRVRIMRHGYPAQPAVPASYLLSGRWLSQRDSLVITGPPASGKTRLAHALAELAREMGYSVVHSMGLVTGSVDTDVLVVDAVDQRDPSAVLALFNERRGHATVLVTPEAEGAGWWRVLVRAIHVRLPHGVVA